jgi:hypothetical protein
MLQSIRLETKRRLGLYKGSARGAVNRALMRRRGGFHNGSSIVAYREGQQGNGIIRELVNQQAPTMIARYGSDELSTISSVLSGASAQEIAMKLRLLCTNCGFFPSRTDLLPRFIEVYEEAAREIDCLAIWNFENGLWEAEERMFRTYSPKACLVSIRSLESWLWSDPWTRSLQGQRVLVVHPFEKSIRHQYARRASLFADDGVLPEFKSLLTLKAVQSAGGTPTSFDTWFDALDAMCSDIERIDFDVALIGAGAYGMPLAAFVKRLGRKAVHMGGATQILFGVIGRRWEKRIPGGYPPLTRFVNQHWTRPLPEETPAGFKSVGRGGYW